MGGNSGPFTRLSPTERAAQLARLTQQRRDHAHVFTGLTKALRHLKLSTRAREAAHEHFHSARDGGPCTCCLCAPERYTYERKNLPPKTEPDRFLWEDGGRVVGQAASPLFGVLPTEVRMMVWEVMFAGHVVQLNCSSEGWFETLSLERLRPPFVDGSRYSSLDRRFPNFGQRSSKAEMWKWYTGSYSGLHRTCRLIYSETKQMLYERNLFYMSSSFPPYRLPDHLRPNWLSLIQNVYIEIGTDKHEKELHLVTALPALRELVVVRRDTYQRVSSRNDRSMLRLESQWHIDCQRDWHLRGTPVVVEDFPSAENSECVEDFQLHDLKVYLEQFMKVHRAGKVQS